MKSTRSQVLIVLWKEYREQRDKRTLLLSMGITSMISVPVYCLPILFFMRGGLESAVEIMRGALYTYFSLAAYLVAATIFTASVFYRERQTGTLEGLLATPIRPAAVWLGKTFFVFLAGLCFAVLVIATVTVIVNLLRPPGASLFLPSIQGLLVFFGLFPVTGFCLSALTGFFYLRTSQAAIAQLGSMGLAALCFVLPILGASRIMVSWRLVAVASVGCLILAAAVWIASRFLDRETLVTG